MADKVGFIGVHVGAGFYQNKEFVPEYEKLCRVAAKRGIEAMNMGQTSLDAVTIATAILEDHPLVNAGFGSNLTMDGHVECDAGIMNGYDMTFGAVGAVSCAKNPICLAKKICTSQNHNLGLGRIPPCIVVGQGADALARKYSDVITVCPESLISNNAVKQHRQNKEKLEKHIASLDTVGAIAIDKDGKIAAAASSGGILLKKPGRLGQAAMFGCGCWAENGSNSSDASVAITTSGCGEYLIKTIFARDIAKYLKTSNNLSCVALHEGVNNLFLNSPILSNVDAKFCGLLALKHTETEGEFLFAHTTPGFCVGYMSTKWNKAKSRLSEMYNDKGIGRSVLIEGISIYQP